MSFWILCGGVLLGKSSCSAGSEPGGEPALLTARLGSLCSLQIPWARGVSSQPLGKLSDDYQ